MEKNKLKISIKDLQKISNVTKEPDWYTLFRKKSLYESYNLEFPELYSMELENWNLLDFYIDNFCNNINQENNNDNNNIKELIKDKENIIIIQKNNKIIYINIPKKYENKIIVNNIFEAMKDKNFKNNFSQITSSNKNKLSAFHYILLNSGINIEVKNYVVIDEPIQYIVQLDEKEYSLYNHTLIKLGKNSKINFIENYISESNNKNFNIVTEVLVEENSTLDYSSITNFNKKQKGSIIRNGITHRNATLNWNIAAMDSADIYCDNNTNILGDGSESNLKIVTLGTGKQKLYFNSELVNQGLNTNGDILQHGVLIDQSHIVFNGIGFIVKGSSGSNAYQSSRLLTLSNQAKADANPMLLIDENDVAAGHGASLGKIDEEQIYYLKSRGLSEKEASRLIIHGFLSPVIEKLTIKSVQEETTKLINLKINKESK